MSKAWGGLCARWLVNSKARSETTYMRDQKQGRKLQLFIVLTAFIMLSIGFHQTITASYGNFRQGAAAESLIDNQAKAVSGSTNVSARQLAVSSERAASPSEIIQNMLRRYQAIESYEASGSTKITEIQDSNKSKDDIPFALYFMRPGLMRLEWSTTDSSTKKRKNVLWSNGKETRLDVRAKELNTASSLEAGLRRASTLSNVAPYLIAHLLIDDEDAEETLLTMQQLNLLSSESVDGVDCYVITGDVSLEPPLMTYKLWIGKKDLLLRKLQSTLYNLPELGGGTTIMEETHHKIKINGKLASSLFTRQTP